MRSMMRLVLMSLPDCAQLIPFADNYMDILGLLCCMLFVFYARQLYRQVLLTARISYGNSVCLSVCRSVCHDPVRIQGQMR